MTTSVDAKLRAQAIAIARKRKEHDELGPGLGAVVRKWLRDYVRRHGDLLPDDLRN